MRFPSINIIFAIGIDYQVIKYWKRLLIQMQIRQGKFYNLKIKMNIQSNSYENPNSKCKGCQLFFGAQAFQGLCSSCYKKQQAINKQPIEKIKIDSLQPQIAQPVHQEQHKQQQIEVKDRSRCNNCKRKLGILGIECKCGLMFCNKHRMPQDHKCSYDFMSEGIKYLQKNLVKVCHKKIEKLQ